ncbi:Nitrosoguanidine resistance SNG1 protein [Rutstroemia sp. NJR-2017a WRK4]|nr:Nitrosoguanidine resistance SNG1 protein [Rutstroemia sp. NJR-2017a WRK4]
MESRLLWRDPFWNGKRKPFIKSLIMAGIMVILLFLIIMCYLYGVVFKSGLRAHNLNILAVDYDGGVIGEALSAAYKQLQGDEFPELQFHPATQYPSIVEVRNAVCRGDYWGAVVAQPDASNRLSQALAGGSAAKTYDPSDVLTYVWNTARYPAVQVGVISGNLETLIGAASSAYHVLNGSQALSSLNATDKNAVLAFLNPIRSSNINIKQTEQGARVFYNTVSVVLPVIQQFFFLMALNGINNQFGIYGRLNSTRIGLMRMFISIVYTFVASLATTGYIWAFREGWDVDGGQFALMWMSYWIYMHINFLVLDTATAFIPVSFLTFFVLPWAILNIASSVYPFELSAGFFRWGYAIPGHEFYTLAAQIESGCGNVLHIALPILFSWEVVGTALAILGSSYRNRHAKADLVAEKEAEREEKAASQASTSIFEDEEAKMMALRRRESILSRRESMLRRRQSAAGPSLPLPFQGSIYHESSVASSLPLPLQGSVFDEPRGGIETRDGVDRVLYYLDKPGRHR